MSVQAKASPIKLQGSYEHEPKRINYGTLPEFPQISINGFSNLGKGKEKVVDFAQSLAFFLTHIDDATMYDLFNSLFLRGLEHSNNDSLRLYMHKNVFLGSKYWIQLQKIAQEDKDITISLMNNLFENGKIVFLEQNVPIRLHFKKKARRRHTYENFIINKSGDQTLIRDLLVDVTAISAGHSPGSVMLLIEIMQTETVPFQRILYTGNCRVTLKDLNNADQLISKDDNSNIILKPITGLYIDTTNCIELVEELPSRSEVEKILVKIIQNQLFKTPNNRFEIWFSYCLSSSLHFLCCLHESFKEVIHIPPREEIFFAKFKKLRDICTVNGENKPFHYCCQSSDKNKFCGFNQDADVKDVYLYADTFPTSSMPSIPSEQMNKYYAIKQPVFLDKNLNIHALYASSLSRYEMGRMINHLKINPVNVKPLYLPAFKTMKQVQALMSATCFKMANSEAFNMPKSQTEYISSEIYDFTGASDLPMCFEKKISTYLHVDSSVGAWPTGEEAKGNKKTSQIEIVKPEQIASGDAGEDTFVTSQRQPTWKWNPSQSQRTKNKVKINTNKPRPSRLPVPIKTRPRWTA